MRDLLVITPSRSRPDRLAEMLRTTLDLSAAETDVAVAIDADQVNDHIRMRNGFIDNPRVIWYGGPRDTLTGWTNQVARLHTGNYRALASLGDDHLPRTQGWDSLLLGALGRLGGTGIAYGCDGIFNERLPTAPVISSGIVEALGWMCVPCCRHMAVDLAWKDLGLAADCLVHVPEVIIEHCHPIASKAAWDQTYAESEALKDADRDAYFEWKDSGGLAAAAETVRALREERAA